MIAELKVDVSEARDAAKRFGIGLQPREMTETAAAIKVGAQAMQAEWLKYISGVTVSYSGGDFQINRVSGQYAQVVSDGLRYPMDGNPLKGGVEVNLDYADKLERGFGQFDIKIGLLASPKAKMTKGSKNDPPHLYINVPFRHDEEDIPTSMLAKAKAGEVVSGAIRLGKGLGSGQAGWRSKTTTVAGGTASYTWHSGLYAGLKRKPAGPQGSGKYMTFRRVSQNSDPASWINPGADPKPVSKAVEENLKDSLTELVSDAFARDVLRMSHSGATL